MRRPRNAPPSISSRVNFLPNLFSAFRMTLTASEVVKLVYLNPWEEGGVLVEARPGSNPEIKPENQVRTRER